MAFIVMNEITLQDSGVTLRTTNHGLETPHCVNPFYSFYSIALILSA